MSRQLAIDIGGTFTDLYMIEEDGTRQTFKASTTPDNLLDGVTNVLEKAADENEISVEELLGTAERLVHGSTISTNAIIEDDTAETAFITTDGFRDTLRLREGGKDDPYDLHMDFPEPYVPRSLTYGVDERVNAEGEVEEQLDEDQVVSVIETLQSQDVEAVAVALLWSHVNPAHEQRIGELIEEHAPELDYSLSHEVNPTIREYRRASSTAIDASITSLVQQYLDRLEDRLSELGFDGVPLIITSNGGVMEPAEVSRSPIWTVDSGPTMFPVAAADIVDQELGRSNVIALDMGGTSLDMGIVEDGSIPRTREALVGDDYMLGIDKVRVESIGSGGGSIAWVDEGGLLHVGPESAGADPGPASYLRGGEEPTVTDAALVLNYLNEDYFLGGDMNISRDAALEAFEGVGDVLGMDSFDAARAVYDTTVQDIVDGVESVTVERGLDPRNFVLSGGGGALGMFAVPAARELQVDDVLLPSAAGVVSAMGGLASDLRRDFSTSNFTVSDRFDVDSVNETLADLENRARDFFERVAIPEEDRDLTFYVEARYPQQVWELEVELPFTRVGEGDVDRLTERFEEVHESTYGFRTGEEVEFLSWRVEAAGETGQDMEPGATASGRSVADARYSERDAVFNGEVHASPAYREDSLEPGHQIDGPGFVDGENTTIVLPPDSSLTITERGDYHIQP